MRGSCLDRRYLDDLCTAISEKRVVVFNYAHPGQTRRVEPYVVGLARNQEALLEGWQLEGFSRSGRRFGWKTFNLRSINALQVTKDRFSGLRPGFRSGARHVKVIWCSVTDLSD